MTKKGMVGEFKVGDMAVYPAHGVGKIDSIETRSISGSEHKFYILKIHPGFFGNNCATRQYCNILQHFLSSVSIPWGLDSNALQSASEFIDNQCSESFTFHIFCNYEKL